MQKHAALNKANLKREVGLKDDAGKVDEWILLL
jgi:hypothetical protein